jgi:hypothetical protein
MPMRLLRTAAGEFINTTAIARLQRDGDGVGWLAVLAAGEAVLLAPYYSAPGRVEQDFPHLVPDPAAVTVPAAAACRAEACCAV